MLIFFIAFALNGNVDKTFTEALSPNGDANANGLK